MREIIINNKSKRLLELLLTENPVIANILRKSTDELRVKHKLKKLVKAYFEKNPIALAFCKYEKSDRNSFEKLEWRDYAAIRISDYIDNSGKIISDLNLRGEEIESDPIKLLWEAVHTDGHVDAEEAFFKDMLHLFRQFSGKSKRHIPSKKTIMKWMDRHPSGLDSQIIKIRKENKKRILKIIIKKINSGEIKSASYNFEKGLTEDEKFIIANEWWKNKNFHLKFAIRSPELLNEMMNFSLSEVIMQRLRKAKKAGMPFFVNPYYLSLLNIKDPDFAIGSDIAIRDYILYSEKLIKEFGHIVAWEKEDIVEAGLPNTAGWLLPEGNNIHRRYPEVSILIPDTIGRACGGLCASCQRMYDFQSGNLNFNLQKLRPKESWPEKLRRLMDYFENDAQLRDILLTGGDALMSSDRSLKLILDEIYEMAIRKKAANKNRKEGEKYAEIVRIRIGTRLPVYIPFRITPELTKLLKDFKKKAKKIGIKQFVVQTHFETAMEITPEVKKAISMLISSGWLVTNQQVFTAAASRRGHTAKLRKVLNDVGILTYYTFSVKGYQENSHNFATNERAIQEQIEEKIVGTIQKKHHQEIKDFLLDAPNILKNISALKKKCNIPFLATGRNVLNLPGVGKSLSFRTIGITNDGRRVLEFEHDITRQHSPIIDRMGKITIVEAKSLSEYFKQLKNMGEDLSEYVDLNGYSIGETEARMPIFEYPKYDFKVTKEITNMEI